MIDVYLTRRGKWLVWTNYPVSRYALVWQEDVVAAVESFVPDGRYIRTLSPTPNPKFSASVSIPLVLADGLARVFEESISKKKQRLAQDEHALAGAMNILDVIADY